MLFISMGIPLIDGITSLLLTMIEAAKGYFGLIVMRMNEQMRNSESDTSLKQPIGFVFDNEEEEEESDEEIL